MHGGPDMHPAAVRELLDNSLAILQDTRLSVPVEPDEYSDAIVGQLKSLHHERQAFFREHDYRWALSAEAYHNSFEMLLQWRLLNVLSDISSDHPDLERASNIVVRVVPNLSARAHVRSIDQFNVIVLPTGYLSMFKGFTRVWFKGRGLAHPFALASAYTYSTAAEHFLLAVKYRKSQLIQGARAYLGLLFQMSQNEMPFMDRESIFDEEIIRRDLFLAEFEQLAISTDAFILFHEAAHILNGDSPREGRSTVLEIGADRGSVSLSIIDESRGGGGRVVQGGTIFFCAELLRGLVVEYLARAEGEISSKIRLPGIEELMARSGHFTSLIHDFLPTSEIAKQLKDFTRAMSLVFDTVRWAMLDMLPRSALEISDDMLPLAEFLESRSHRQRRSELLWTPGEDLHSTLRVFDRLRPP
jgi:hypothetical protein